MTKTATQTIPKGYKQTEIGVIPEDWEVKNMGDLGRSIIGLTYSPDDVVKYGRLVHRSSNIQNNKLAYEDNVYVDKEIKENLILQDNDILICVRNGSRELIGKAALIKDKSAGETFGAFMSVFRSNKNQKFIFYVVLSEIIQRQIRESLGATINQITNKTLNNFQIPYPEDPKEQLIISNTLTDTGELIEKLEKLIEKKRAIKQGAMQELLTGKKRLPGFSGEWKEKSLGEIGIISGSGIDKTINSDEQPIRLVNYLDVFHKDFIYSKELNHWVTAPSDKIQKCSVKKGDIFFTPSSEMRYEIAISTVAMEDIEDAGYSYHVTRLRLNEENKDWDFKFRSYIFKTKYFLDQAETICEGSGKRYVISLTKFRQLKIRFPKDPKEQTAISNVISDMDAEIDTLEKSLEKYRQIKTGMMQNLLTGKIRLIKN